MRSTAIFLAVMAILAAVLGLWANNRAQASDVVSLQVLDDSHPPLIVARLTCESSDTEELIGQCRAALLKLCPDGGTLSDLEESAQGVLPARIAFTATCTRDEPAI